MSGNVVFPNVFVVLSDCDKFDGVSRPTGRFRQVPIQELLLTSVDDSGTTVVKELGVF